MDIVELAAWFKQIPDNYLKQKLIATEILKLTTDYNFGGCWLNYL
jgi:hypothetical protein